MSHIPLLYRIFFLYIDPLICLSGIYIFFTSPILYITNGTPTTISHSHPDPTVLLNGFTDYLLTSLGSYALFVFAMQILLLHGFNDAAAIKLRIWKRVQFGILLIDLGLLYGVWRADPAGFWKVAEWDQGDWTNNGILGFVALTRTAFLVGLGGVGRDSK
ncbi:hypothetical protein BJ875DRAFT_466758 [Amylocarpus encephaloides]|uniref:DUF7704 domain-containing protein n=1 Tax=Amylocarpus encephaloides TaxID=45428 RepID=A0A9P7YG66_9HELO|nr:hypothetical protein BJ875DRAFT_466758 [Amylocarpus encephaloides]